MYWSMVAIIPEYKIPTSGAFVQKCLPPVLEQHAAGSLTLQSSLPAHEIAPC
jgi:hypothetical protein